ncbi:hypothetical protein L596_011863 [Steinernema carpocapsae]|uniref:Uncharacterized protein n=1 Tax=Steinernema carpocapsae TaxID=34508 RepID=A0A4U5NW61_STECR|nr:hypothetical protein L596_011863 [Steinernema carpocapsae]
MDFRVIQFRYANYSNIVFSTFGLFVCFGFYLFVEFQQVVTGGRIQIQPYVTSNEIIAFSCTFLLVHLAANFMIYVSEAKSNTSYFGYYTIISLTSCLLSFFSLAHIWTLIQMMYRAADYQEEDSKEARFFEWYFFRLLFLAICFCWCFIANLLSLLLYRTVKEIVHDSQRGPNFRYTTFLRA